MRQNLPATRQAREPADGAEAGDGHYRTEVLELVEGLAFRAHLVALDAAVEVALAGERGRCFGTVAAEMLQLAHHTVDVAEHIRGRLDEVRKSA